MGYTSAEGERVWSAERANGQRNGERVWEGRENVQKVAREVENNGEKQMLWEGKGAQKIMGPGGGSWMVS